MVWYLLYKSQNTHTRMDYIEKERVLASREVNKEKKVVLLFTFTLLCP